jgi:hypothetical protein
MLVAPSHLHTGGRRFALVVGGYLIGRAIVEPFLIDMTDPAAYHLDWGGPHLAGVLAVHCGPGVVAAVLIARCRSARCRSARCRSARRRSTHSESRAASENPAGGENRTASESRTGGGSGTAG